MTKLVGILNVTPDSFSDGGHFFDAAKAIKQAEKLFSEGASLVDVGAESTRPNAVPLTPEQEWERLESILAELLLLYPGKISLDTYHPETVHKAFAIGPVIVNDVTGMRNPDMMAAVVQHNAECIVSHIGNSDIQAAHAGKPTSTVKEVKDHLLAKESLLIKKGLDANKIILDPGVGFGKTPKLNHQLLEFAKYMPGKRIMVGYSRKRFLGDKRMELEPNLEAARTAIASGATYLRVHDVAGHQAVL